MSALAELIKNAGVPVSRTPQRLRDLPVTLSKERRIELETVLHLRDGFRAVGGALLVRPSTTVGTTMGLSDWNRLSGWRKPYSASSELLFFAEDIFGHQFALYRDEVVRFDPERGEFEHFAFKLERWASRVIEERIKLGALELLAREKLCKPALETTQKLQPNAPRIRPGTESLRYIVRSDVDLMTRYARLFRELSKDPDADLSWWKGDDPSAPATSKEESPTEVEAEAEPVADDEV